MLKEYAEYKELGAQIICYFSKMEKENINSDEEAEIKKKKLEFKKKMRMTH